MCPWLSPGVGSPELPWGWVAQLGVSENGRALGKPKAEQLRWGEAAVTEQPCARWALIWAGLQKLFLHDHMHGLDK